MTMTIATHRGHGSRIPPAAGHTTRPDTIVDSAAGGDVIADAWRRSLTFLHFCKRKGYFSKEYEVLRREQDLNDVKTYPT